MLLPKDNPKKDSVAVSFYSEKTQKTMPGQAELMTWDKPMAMKKALNGLWICWGLAILSLPIPLVHFVSVPILIIAGPIAVYAIFKMYMGSVDVLSGAGTCPDCHAQVFLEAKTAIWPQSLTCSQCQAPLQVNRV